MRTPGRKPTLNTGSPGRHHPLKHHRRIQIQNHAASGLAAILRVFISLALAGILFPLADGAPAIAQDSYRKAVMAEPALISYYSFEGDLRDATGAHHGASVAGAAVGFAPGVGGGKAVSLDGSGGISLGRVTAMEFASGNGTVEAWIRAAWQPGTRRKTQPSSRYDDDQRGGSRYSIHIRQADRSTLDVFSTGKGVAAFQPFDLTDDGFHHVAVVFSIGFVAVYLDGQLVQSHPAGLGPLGVSAQVGHYSSHADGKAWIGQIDELAVYGGRSAKKRFRRT